MLTDFRANLGEDVADRLDDQARRPRLDASFHARRGAVLVELASGITLDHNTQAGVWFAENDDNPLAHLKWWSNDTTIKDAEGNVLGDVLVSQNIDPDGDIAWTYQVWWYREGVGENVILGGTGKWKGVTGVGRTFGLKMERADDHFMAEAEMYWKIED